MLTPFVRAFRTPDLRKKLLFTLAIIALFRLGSIVPTPGIDYKAVHAALHREPEQQHLRPGQPVQRRRAAPAVRVRARDHALHHELDHHPAAGRRHPAPRAAEGRRASPGRPSSRSTPATSPSRSRSCSPPASSRSPGAAGCSTPGASGPPLVPDSSVFRLTVMVMTMTAGTAVIMWLGELITDRGVGNGMSVLIFTQIIARLPYQGGQILQVKGAFVFGLVLRWGWSSWRRWSSSNRASGGSLCSTPSAWSAGGCTAGPRRTSRSRSTRPVSSRSSSPRRCCTCRSC